MKNNIENGCLGQLYHYSREKEKGIPSVIETQIELVLILLDKKVMVLIYPTNLLLTIKLFGIVNLRNF